MSKPKIAAILTEYFTNSHADVIVTKYLRGFPTDDGLIPPRTEIVSIYLDQTFDRDVGRGYAAEYGVPIYESIPKALCLGGDKLAVDGVLLIGEHGDYAWNEKEQHLYPRKFFMEQICGVFATSGRSVPIFNDKHLSYNWADAKWMYDRANALNVPFMAGSSVPTAWRSPWVEHDLGTPIDEALAIGYSGLDVYGFHTLEALQCMVERRAAQTGQGETGYGETGVAAVTCLEGDAVWQAAEDGLWSRELADRAIEIIEKKKEGSVHEHCPNPALFLVEYRDGFRGAVLLLTGFVTTFAYAARVGDEIVATEMYLQTGLHHAHFSYLSLNVEEMFVTGKPSYPVERTLLTTGILEAALDSRYQGHVRIETPHLDVAYTPAESFPHRPSGERPAGATLTPLE
ncbi:MAG: hypothetical protein WDZ49_03840 [Litorilinea sp.]